MELSALEDLGNQGDTPLDHLVNEMAKELGGVVAMARLFKEVHSSKRLPLARLRTLLEQGLVTAEIVEFFAGCNKLPKDKWVDVGTIRRGGEFFREKGLIAFTGLAFASLPACYCWNIEADVLATTGRLSNKDRIPRRIPETAQFVLDIGTMDAFQEGGVGIQAAHKIRLMHAIIRYLLVKDPAAVSVDPDKNDIPPWDEAKFGPPISQEFLTATLLTFHFVILQSMQKLNVKVSNEEGTAYLHRWNLAGYFLGIDQLILSSLDSYVACQQVFSSMMAKHRELTPNGAELSQTLISYVKNNVIERVTGGLFHPLAHIPVVLTRYLSGKQTSTSLSIHLSWIEQILYYPLVGGVKLVGFLDNFPISQWLTRKLIRYATKHIWAFAEEPDTRSELTASQAHQRVVFVPKELSGAWRLDRG